MNNEVTRTVCHEKLGDATPSNARKLVKRIGINNRAGSRVPCERNLKPHQVKEFRPIYRVFSEKLENVVELDLSSAGSTAKRRR